MYRAAIDAAVAAWPYIDGMMQYARKYEERGFAGIAAIDVVLRNAPLLLDAKSLAALEELLATRKRIERDTSDDVTAELAAAREHIWDNHRLWAFLESNPDARQDELRQCLGGDQEYWRWVAEAWEKMGLLRRTPEGRSYRLALATRMGQVIDAKCPSCGEVVHAPKAMLLEPSTCPGCASSVPFVLLESANVG